MTQEQWVLKYLEEYGEITPLDAYREFAIMRLSAYILKLRQRGYNIETIRESGKNRFGHSVSYARYKLGE